MKNFITVLAVTLSLTATAQMFIPKAGLTLSTVNFEIESSGSGYDESINSATGFAVGVGYSFGLGSMFSIQPELLFIQKGWNYNETYDDGGSYSYEYDETAHLNYIELPVLFKVSLGPDNLKFHINAGPSVGFGIGGKFKEKYNEDYFGDPYSYSEDVKIKFGDMPDNYDGTDYYIDNSIDFGLQIGGGVTIAEKIIIDIRYGLGLSDLFDEADGSGESRNRVLQFTVGVPIRLGL